MILRQHFADFGLVFGVAFIAALLLTPLVRWWGLKTNIVAIPGGRRLHQGRIASTGGLALYTAFTLAAIVAQFIPVQRTDSNEIIRFTGLILGSGFIMLVGFLDDKYELKPLTLYLSQLIAGAIAVAFLIFIETFNNPLTGKTVGDWNYLVTITLSLFWFGLMTNTVNWLDGSDGLAAGVVCIAAFMIFLHSAFRLNQVSVSLLPLALVGATLGFLPYNFHPAKIFMGGGAFFLGYVLAVLSIIGGAKMATILLVMGLPLADLTWQITRRLLRGQNPMKSDRGHLHFMLTDAGVSPRIIALSYYAFCAFFGGIALTTTSQLFKLLAIGVMFGIVSLAFVVISTKRNHFGKN